MILFLMTYSSFSLRCLMAFEHLPFPDILLLLQGERFLRVERAFLKRIEVGQFMVVTRRGIEREIPCGHPLFHLDDVAFFDVKIARKLFVLRFALTVRCQGFSHFANLIEKLLLNLSRSDFSRGSRIS